MLLSSEAWDGANRWLENSVIQEGDEYSWKSVQLVFGCGNSRPHVNTGGKRVWLCVGLGERLCLALWDLSAGKNTSCGKAHCTWQSSILFAKYLKIVQVGKNHYLGDYKWFCILSWRSTISPPFEVEGNLCFLDLGVRELDQCQRDVRKGLEQGSHPEAGASDSEYWQVGGTRCLQPLRMQRVSFLFWLDSGRVRDSGRAGQGSNLYWGTQKSWQF